MEEESRFLAVMFLRWLHPRTPCRLQMRTSGGDGDKWGF